MEKLIDLLKIFEEKHLISAIASFAFAILGVALAPDFFGLIDSVGEIVYGMLLFCILFLLIQFGKFVYSFIKKKIARKQKQKKAAELQQKIEEEREKKTIEDLWDYVDSLSSQDKHYIMKFLITDNKPIEVSGFVVSGLLSNSNLVACTEKNNALDPSSKIEFEGRLVYTPQDIPFMTYQSPVKLYRLKDDFFKLLKYSYKKHHKISHFDMEEEINGQAENANSK